MPHKLTETFSAEVLDLTYQGYGVVQHPSGKIFFVKGAWPGDVGEFKFSPDDLAQKPPPFAVLAEIIKPALARKKPECAHFGFGKNQCQGCSWMMSSYDHQLTQKQKRLQQALQEMGLAASLQPIWPAQKTEGYRNRAQFKTDGAVLGYVSDDNSIAPITDCRILNKPLRGLLRQLQKTLPNPAWKPKLGKPWVFLDCDDEMTMPDVAINRRRPFKQGNSEQNERMRGWLDEKLKAVGKTAPILELFCGSGNFTQILASAGFADVACVESDETAIFKIKQKNWLNVTPLTADLYHSQTFARLQQKMGRREVLVLDPPREGLQHKTQLFQSFPKLNTIFYISCDPESFARDAKFFVAEQGFAINEIQPLDLFPQTPHVEVMAVFVK